MPQEAHMKMEISVTHRYVRRAAPRPPVLKPDQEDGPDWLHAGVKGHSNGDFIAAALAAAIRLYGPAALLEASQIRDVHTRFTGGDDDGEFAASVDVHCLNYGELFPQITGRSSPV
jgi:hypothetical protein